MAAGDRKEGGGVGATVQREGDYQPAVLRGRARRRTSMSWRPASQRDADEEE